MDAARKGKAMKMRRSTPIFQTMRQASPSEGGGSTGVGSSGASARGAGSPSSDATICSESAELLVPAPRRFAQAGPDDDDDDDRHGEDEERCPPGKSVASPAPISTPAMTPMLYPTPVGRVDAWPCGHRVVVGEQGVVRREDDGLSHVDTDEHDGEQHHGGWPGRSRWRRRRRWGPRPGRCAPGAMRSAEHGDRDGAGEARPHRRGRRSAGSPRW